MTNAEVNLMIEALQDIVTNIDTYEENYVYDNHTNVFRHKNEKGDEELMQRWFTL